MRRPPDPTAGAEEASLRLRLLDAQVVDADDLPVGRVDDLELTPDEHGVRVTALLVGQRPLGARLGGLTGGLLTRSARRLTDDSTDGRVDASAVASWPGMPKLRDRLADLPVAGLEKWLSKRVVGRLPGADDEGI